MTSNTTKTEFEGLTSKPIKVITNGFDAEPKPIQLDKDFTISHLGSLLTGRNPVVLWQTLQQLVIENENFRNHLKIQLAGVVGAEVWESIVQFGLESFVHRLGYLSHEKVLEVQQKSQVLLLLEIDSVETKGIIPGKLFEYLNARRPILAIGPDKWEAGKMVVNTKAGTAFTPKDTSNLKTVLLDWFAQYSQGKLEVESVGIEKFHRRELTKELVKFIPWESS